MKPSDYKIQIIEHNQRISCEFLQEITPIIIDLNEAKEFQFILAANTKLMIIVTGTGGFSGSQFKDNFELSFINKKIKSQKKALIN